MKNAETIADFVELPKDKNNVPWLPGDWIIDRDFRRVSVMEITLGRNGWVLITENSHHIFDYKERSHVSSLSDEIDNVPPVIKSNHTEAFDEVVKALKKVGR